MPKDIIRRCLFRPYLAGKGPTFALTVWDTGRYGGAFTGRVYLGYRLTMSERGKRTLLFTGADFSPSPMDGIDSDSSIKGLRD